MFIMRAMIFPVAVISFVFYALLQRNTSKQIQAFSTAFGEAIGAMTGRYDGPIGNAVEYIYGPEEKYQMAIRRYVEDGNLLDLEQAAEKRYKV